jgi:hypothetical protein
MHSRAYAITWVVSLLLCAATLIMWLASFLAFAPFGQRWTTYWDGNSEYLERCWIASNGSLHLIRSDRMTNPAPTSTPSYFRKSGIDPFYGFQPMPTRFGFARFSHVATWREHATGVQVTLTTQQLSFPIWPPAILFAILPFRRFAADQQYRKRRARGLCSACSYNLTANTSGVCPECGTTVV